MKYLLGLWEDPTQQSLGRCLESAALGEGTPVLFKTQIPPGALAKSAEDSVQEKDGIDLFNPKSVISFRVELSQHPAFRG